VEHYYTFIAVPGFFLNREPGRYNLLLSVFRGTHFFTPDSIRLPLDFLGITETDLDMARMRMSSRIILYSPIFGQIEVSDREISRCSRSVYDEFRRYLDSYRRSDDYRHRGDIDPRYRRGIDRYSMTEHDLLSISGIDNRPKYVRNETPIAKAITKGKEDDKLKSELFKVEVIKLNQND